MTNSIRHLLLLLTAALAGALSLPQGLALDRSAYSVEILVGGRPLPEYAARGTTYIEALRGREYAIRLTNHSSRRIAVALTVDGLNTIDARTTSAEEASKWVLGPYQTVTIEGWQTGNQTARRFIFTSEKRSYGAWLGKTDNLGLIAAAVFEERHPRPLPLHHHYPAPPRSNGEPLGGLDSRGPVPSESAPTRQEAESKSKAETSDQAAGTGIGREYDNRVESVDLELERHPAALFELRYEYHPELVRLGVLPRPERDDRSVLERRERARGFEPDRFCPDPFRHH